MTEELEKEVLAEEELPEAEEQTPSDLLKDDFYELTDKKEFEVNFPVDMEDNLMAMATSTSKNTYYPRLVAPGVDNKNWIKTTYGGYNYCININNGSVLPNCVGYAWGRWREILGEYHNLSRGNAENWFPNKGDGYSRGDKPKLGAVICWRKGAIYNESDGAGHVAIVESIENDGTIVTSNSAYGGTRFYLRRLTPPYAIGGGYTFQGFIYNPMFDYDEDDEGEVKYVQQDEYNVGDEVLISGPLYRTARATDSAGYVTSKETTITRKVLGTKHPYNTTGDLGWMDTKNIKRIVVIPDGGDTPTPPTPTPPTPAPKSIDELAREVIAGKWGNGAERVRRLTEAGYDYVKVQTRVNEILGENNQIKPGDKVKVLKAVTYDGKPFVTWYKVYDVIQVNGNRIVIGIGRVVTAAVNKVNLQKV